MAAEPTTVHDRTIFRKAKRRNYTVIDNACLDDRRLSFKAVGLLVFLLSKPDDWRFNYRHITTTHADGEAAVKSGMKELEILGYLTRERKRQDDGTFAWVITVHEEPCGGFPLMDHPLMENRPLLSTEGPSTEKPSALTLLNDEPAPTSAAIDEEFERWWKEAWPSNRRVSKADAKLEYRRARKDTPAKVLFDGATAYARLMRQQQTEPRHISHPHRWLKKRRWEDETPAAPDPYSGPEMRFG